MVPTPCWFEFMKRWIDHSGTISTVWISACGTSRAWPPIYFRLLACKGTGRIPAGDKRAKSQDVYLGLRTGPEILRKSADSMAEKGGFEPAYMDPAPVASR